ncbi:MAG: hypothetical protein IT430_14350 [Phycisphaerales bacterium]|nr:hypothetical protein [Phycisphaerales bacterium]
MNDYFKDSIEVYTIPCIRRLRDEIRPDEQGLQGCTVALALATFAVLDLFGFLLRPDSDAVKTEARKNLEFIFTRCETLFEPQLDEAVAELLILVFRHGVVHQYFAKSAGLAREGNRLPLVTQTTNGRRQTPILNVDALATSTIEFSEKVKKHLLASGNEIELSRFCGRLRSLLQEDRCALQRCMTCESRLLMVDIQHATLGPPLSHSMEPELPPIG